MKLDADRREISIRAAPRSERRTSFAARLLRAFYAREKTERTHRAKDFLGKEGPSRTRKSTAENYGRRRNSRDVASVKNCIFSCQKLGGGRRGGRRESARENEGSACTSSPFSSVSTAPSATYRSARRRLTEFRI